MENENNSADISHLKQLIEKSKADLFLEAKANAQLQAECTCLAAQLMEKVSLYLMVFALKIKNYVSFFVFA